MTATTSAVGATVVQRWRTVRWVLLALVVDRRRLGGERPISPPRAPAAGWIRRPRRRTAPTRWSRCCATTVSTWSRPTTSPRSSGRRGPTHCSWSRRRRYLIDDDGLQRLADLPGDVLLVEPLSRTREALAPEDPHGADDTSFGGDPDCDMREATRAGSVQFGPERHLRGGRRRRPDPLLRRRAGALHRRRTHRHRRRHRGLHDELGSAAGGQRRAGDEPGRVPAHG